MRQLTRIGFVRLRRPIPNDRFALAALIACLACLNGSSEASQVLLQPNTTGTFSWDWFGSPRNQGQGFGNASPLTLGAYQKTGFTRNYRSYMIFDTAEAGSAILSANLELTVDWRTTVTLTNPLSALDITLGLPKQFSAEQIADPYTSSNEPASSLIYADLATNGLASISIPFGDVYKERQTSDITYSIPMPLSFVAAFNQARLTTRYVTVSIFGGDYGFYSAGIEMKPQLTVNTLNPVPEPMSMTSLAVGLTLIVIRKRRSFRMRSTDSAFADRTRT
jgi:hypothetical protein